MTAVDRYDEMDRRYWTAVARQRMDPEQVSQARVYDYLLLRHEAPNDRVGVRDPPPLGRRSGSMKLGAA